MFERSIILIDGFGGVCRRGRFLTTSAHDRDEVSGVWGLGVDSGDGIVCRVIAGCGVFFLHIKQPQHSSNPHDLVFRCLAAGWKVVIGVVFGGSGG